MGFKATRTGKWSWHYELSGWTALLPYIVLAVIVYLLASCQSSDDRAWADYSRGVNHVLKR